MMIEEFKRWLQRRNLAEKSIKCNHLKTELFLRWLNGKGKTLQEVDPDVVFKFVEYLIIERKQTVNTRRSYMFCIRNYFDFLVDQHIIPKNPAREITIPGPTQIPQGSISEEDIAKLMTVAFEKKNEIGMRDLAIISVLAGTGCRVSALCKMRLGDFRVVDLIMPEKCQHCGQSILTGRFAGRGKKVKTTMVRLQEKGGKTWDVPLPEKASFYLGQYLSTRTKHANTDIVFPITIKGVVQPIGRHGITQALEALAKTAGIKAKVNPHMFRHAAITWWLDYGVDPETIQRIVGHAQLLQTMMYRNKSMRSFVLSGIAGDKNLLESLPTPMDVLFNKTKR
jgi:site-specific recombinase XerD